MPIYTPAWVTCIDRTIFTMNFWTGPISAEWGILACLQHCERVSYPHTPLPLFASLEKGSQQDFFQVLISRQCDMGVVEKGCMKGEEQASVKAVFLRQIYRQTDRQEHIWTASITQAEIQNVLTLWKLWGQQGKTRWMSRSYCSESFSGSCTDRDGAWSLDYPLY